MAEVQPIPHQNPSPPATATPPANNPLGTDTPPELIPGQPLLVRWNPEWPSFRIVTQVDIWLCSKPNYPDSCRPIQVQVPNELATTGISYDVPSELPTDQEWLLLVTPNGATRGDFARLNAPTFPVRVAASTAPKPPVPRPSPTIPPVPSARPDPSATPGTGAVVDPASPSTTFPIWAISLLVVAALAVLVLAAVMVRRRRSQNQSADRSVEVTTSIPPAMAARDRSSRTSSELSFGPSRSDLGIVALV
ncbi:hypothetical protein BCR44DRAFT_1176950 [Catenaria anguillulae PL171]|uniref:Uncharacterized protein n=1 Tax=Catenaria anguillulae PL171 TaxID=765915 RepID=A0A1Y2I3S0_9FUNG|nr:hypothetical protein BCR44DRAFT_1176950 [Catenaria anguillulae PL171]